MNIQFTDEELYELFLAVDSKCRMLGDTPWRGAIDVLREKLLPVYQLRHKTSKSTVETPNGQ